MHSRNQYLKALVGKYLKASKKGKGELLDEYCRNTGHSRKYVIGRYRSWHSQSPGPAEWCVRSGGIWGSCFQGLASS
jgi:hypothetical protein